MDAPAFSPVVLISGAARGPGRALALAFAAQGACLALNDLNPLGLDEALSQVTASGAAARAYAFDVAKRLPLTGLVQQVLDDWGRVDILVNAAEVMPTDPLLTMDEWDFHRALDVNLAGPFFLMQLVGRAMQAQGGGVILNVIAALPAAQPLSPVCCASRAALAALSQAAAQELAPYSVRVLHLELPTDQSAAAATEAQTALNIAAALQNLAAAATPAAAGITSLEVNE